MYKHIYIYLYKYKFVSIILHSDFIPVFPTKSRETSTLPRFLDIPWLQVAYSAFHIPLKPWESLTTVSATGI